MEMALPQQAALLGLFGLLVLCFSLWVTSGRRWGGKSREPPEAPGRWPVLGHLPVFASREPLARVLARFAEQHGPVLTLWLGGKRMAVVSSRELAKECFSTNDKILASRPPNAAGKYLGYNYAMMGFSPYGPFWREIRKISALELFCPRQLDSLKEVRATETHLCIKDLYRQWKHNGSSAIKVEMRQWFGDVTFNYMVMTMSGKRYFGTDVAEDELLAREFRQVIGKFFDLIAMFVPSDAVPFLEWFDIGGHIADMKKTALELDSFLSAWVQEHRQRRFSHPHTIDGDFIDVMLSTMNKFQFVGHDPDTVIKATCLTMILAGVDTLLVSMSWALCLLLNNLHVLKKVQEELDAHIGRERNAEEEDIKNLPYLQAVVKETMRLYPGDPLGAPHLATESCTIGGYHIPAGTQVLVNVWQIQRDPCFWDHPEEFRPERFMMRKADVDMRGHHFELIPFGAGRRICPGISFALQFMHLTLARLLHGFEFETVGPVDMTESLGMALRKEAPLDVLLSPRLSPHLYQ